MKLTKTNVAALTVPAGKAERVEFDDDIPGFGIRLRAGGSRTWIFQYRQGRKQRRLNFGKVSAMQVHEARTRAAKLHAEVILGHDPAGVKVETRARAAETVEPAIRRFLDRQRFLLKPRSFVEVERHLLKHTKPLHGLQLAKVDTQHRDAARRDCPR